MRNCASGMQALDSGVANMLSGVRTSCSRRRGRALARAAPLFRRDGHVVFELLGREDSSPEGRHVPEAEPTQLLTPIIGIMKGLTDLRGLLMVRRPRISRTVPDQSPGNGRIRPESHARVLRAQENGVFNEPHDGGSGNRSGLRRQRQSLQGRRGFAGLHAENLAKLKPFFDRNTQRHRRKLLADHRRAAWLVLATRRP